MTPVAHGQRLMAPLSSFEPGIRAWVGFRLGDPSKKRYYVCRGFAGNTNSDASVFRSEPTRTI